MNARSASSTLARFASSSLANSTMLNDHKQPESESGDKAHPHPLDCPPGVTKTSEKITSPPAKRHPIPSTPALTRCPTPSKPLPKCASQCKGGNMCLLQALPYSRPSAYAAADDRSDRYPLPISSPHPAGDNPASRQPRCTVTPTHLTRGLLLRKGGRVPRLGPADPRPIQPKPLSNPDPCPDPNPIQTQSNPILVNAKPTSSHELIEVLVVAVVGEIAHVEPVLALADLGVRLGFVGSGVHRAAHRLLPLVSGGTVLAATVKNRGRVPTGTVMPVAIARARTGAGIRG